MTRMLGLGLYGCIWFAITRAFSASVAHHTEKNWTAVTCPRSVASHVEMEGAVVADPAAASPKRGSSAVWHLLAPGPWFESRRRAGSN